MGGGLMQLVAYGAQDIYLTGQPQITFFKLVYKRHTNFAVEAISQTFNGNANWGDNPTCTISRNADLINRMYLQFTTPSITLAAGTPNTNYFGNLGVTNDQLCYVNSIGHALIKHVKVEIGGQKIDEHYGIWLEIWSELTTPSEKQLGYQEMVGKQATNAACLGNGLDPITYFVPLQFWFCRNVGLSLPLIALQYHEVKVSLQFRQFNECIQQLAFQGGVNTAGARSTGAAYTVTAVPPLQPAQGTGNNTQLWVDYVYLDTQERRLFAQKSHEYLIDQLQRPMGENGQQVTGNITSFTQQQHRLNFNHPVKELIWTLQLDCCHNSGTGNSGGPLVPHIDGNDWFNFSTCPPNPGAAQSFQTLAGGGPFGPEFPTAPGGQGTGGVGGTTQGANMYGPLEQAKIILNGHDRFSSRVGKYFHNVVPYERHTTTPAKFIYNYSFALRPEDHQPSGTCNFSRIDNAQLSATLINTGNTAPNYNSSSVPTNPWSGACGQAANANSVNLNVWGTNYNVLRIMSGMGGLAYSN